MRNCGRFLTVKDHAMRKRPNIVEENQETKRKRPNGQGINRLWPVGLRVYSHGEFSGRPAGLKLLFAIGRVAAA